MMTIGLLAFSLMVALQETPSDPEPQKEPKLMVSIEPVDGEPKSFEVLWDPAQPDKCFGIDEDGNRVQVDSFICDHVQGKPRSASTEGIILTRPVRSSDSAPQEETSAELTFEDIIARGGEIPSFQVEWDEVVPDKCWGIANEERFVVPADFCAPLDDDRSNDGETRISVDEIVKTVPLSELENVVFLDPVAKPDSVPHGPWGDVRGVFTVDDYPSKSLMLEEQGTIRAALSVDAGGKIVDCEIEQSSGFDRLDETTCAILLERVTMNPARDKDGEAIAGNYITPPIRWEIPSTPYDNMLFTLDRSQQLQMIERAMDFLDMPTERILVDFGSGGRINACKRITYGEEADATGCGGHFARIHWMYNTIDADDLETGVIQFASNLITIDDYDAESDAWEALGEEALFRTVQGESSIPFLLCSESAFFEEALSAEECLDRLISVRGPDGSQGVPRLFIQMRVTRLPDGEDPGFTEAMRR